MVRCTVFMARLVMTTAAAAIATAAVAQQSAPPLHQPTNPRGGPLDAGPTRYIYAPGTEQRPARRLDDRQVRQIMRWGEVGRCVVARDRETSVSYVATSRGSPMAASAVERLDPVIDSCLVGSGVSRKNDKAYRRAAIADALGMRTAS